MEGADSDRAESGFKRRTRLEDARKRLRTEVTDSNSSGGFESESERLGLGAADGRVLAESVDATRNVPHYERAAMDGYAVRASDTFGASGRSPAVLRVRSGADGDGGNQGETEPDGSVTPGTARRVHTGSELPPGADAVVIIEHATRLEYTGESESPAGSQAELEVTDAVTVGENVAPVGEDIESGQTLYEPGHRLRPSDLGLLRSAGIERVDVRSQPTVGVIPTGEELVTHDPDPGEIVETNGLTVSSLVERWGGRATYRNIVTDDPEALRVAIQRDLTKDVVVTTGGSSVGERDLLPEVIEALGEVLVHGVAIKPGYPVAVGIVDETPVLALPGYPVACIATAVQLLRPLLCWLAGTTPDPLTTTEARLERKIPSEPGIRTFARVRLAGEDESEDEETQTATPTRTGGAGVLSSVALADGWVVVEEDLEGIPAGEMVAVEHWEASL